MSFARRANGLRALAYARRKGVDSGGGRPGRRHRVGRDRAVGPFADNEEHVVLLHEDQWPLARGGLVRQLDELPNRLKIPNKLGIEPRPHRYWSSTGTRLSLE